MINRVLVLMLCLMVVVADLSANAAVTAVPPHLTTGPARYIVQLVDAPLALYEGGIAGLAATNPTVAGATQLDAQTEASQAYRTYLASRQALLLDMLSTTLGREVRPVFQYGAAFNGLALELTGEEAAVLGTMPGVKAIYPEQNHSLLTDAGPAWIGAPAIWNGSSTPDNAPNQGEGIIIGVIDTGINMDHPAFADLGEDGFDHDNPFGNNTYAGACDPGNSQQYDPALACNDKLIGAWDFADNFGESDGPEDGDGHGSHTASTAAGNVLAATMTTPTGYTYVAPISGVAPHANLIAYDACVTSCPGSALLAAVNQAVLDGVQVINYSISGGANPYNDPIELAFLAANEAGVFVSASAGNSGPGPSTLSHQSPWVATVGASTHNRRFDNFLVNISSNGGALPDIAGKSVTAAYGPAPIVYAGDYGDALCLTPFAPGTWSGEIVVCDRGQIARVEKGSNALAGGAGGYVLANEAVNGASLNGDLHVLPAVHITYADGVALKNWLATGSGHMATIAGTSVTINASIADVMAAFSSRGPNTAMDVLKPDIIGPGVDVLAAVHSPLPLGPAEFGLNSGTSMSSPHHAGAAALVKAAHPSWTPDEIRAALMMTAVSDGIRNENGILPADSFARGAGRIDLTAAARAGLVLNEIRANYEAAETGDPKTLNLPSMVDSACFQTCNWTRTLRSTLPVSATWTVSAVTAAGLLVDIMPPAFTVGAGMTQTIQITADVTGFDGQNGWGFADVVLSSPGQATLHLPVAVQKNYSSHPAALSKMSPAVAAPDQIITYEISLDNLDVISHTFYLTDTLPVGVEYVTNSATGGLVYDGVNHRLTWNGEIGPGTLGYEATAVYPPLTYVNLGGLATPPPNLCDLFANCDEAAVLFDLSGNGQSYTFYEEVLSQLFVSSNGVIYGPDGAMGPACVACPQSFPNGIELNQVMAGLWRDMDTSNDAGQWYAGLLTGLLPTDTVFYANWHNAGQYGDPFLTSSHAIAIVLDGENEAGSIYYIYDTISSRTDLTDHGYAIGLENKDGSEGLTIAFAPCQDAPCVAGNPVGALPENGATLRLVPAIVGGSSAMTFTYQGRITAVPNELLTNTVEVGGDGQEMTAVSDVLVEYRYYFPIVAR